jgi:hypothetical protein
MQVLYQRCAAVDIGKDIIAVAVRLPGEGPDHRQTIKRTFKTFYGVLELAARWLTEQQVTHVAVEATGIYSMPVYHALIEHGQFEKVLVCNARLILISFWRICARNWACSRCSSLSGRCGAYCCTERCWPTTRQARRCETPNRSTSTATARRRRSGLTSFPSRSP